MPRQEHLGPGWWIGRTLKHERVDEYISRNQLIDLWTEVALPRVHNSRVFRDQLKPWCSALGKTEWVRQRYGAEVARRLWQDVKNRFEDSYTWDQVCDVLARYGDPLARRSAQFDEIARAHRPPGLPQVWAEIMQEWERNQACTAARDAMINRFDILETEESAATFIANPLAFEKELEAAAGKGYNQALVEYISRIKYSEQLNPRQGRALDLLPMVEDMLVTASNELTERFGKTEDFSRQPTREEIQEVADLLDSFLRRRPDLLSKGRFRLVGDERPLKDSVTTDTTYTEAIGLAWENTHKDLLTFKVNGTPLITDDWMGRIFTTQYGDAVREIRTKDWNRTQREELVSPVADADSGTSKSKLDPKTHGPELEERQVELVLALRSARQALESRNVEKLDQLSNAPYVKASPCWEKSMALQILSSEELAMNVQEMSSISKLIDEKGTQAAIKKVLKSSAPDNCLLNDADASVQLVMKLLKWSFFVGTNTDPAVVDDVVQKRTNNQGSAG